MLSDKQGTVLAMLLVIGACYIPFALADLSVIIVISALFEPLEFNPNPWAAAVLYLVIACGLLTIVGVTILATRKFKGRLSTARFYLLTVITFIMFVVLSYVAIVTTNVTLNMGWTL